MTLDQTIAFGILAFALALFVWGRWRHDVVAVIALLAVAITGLVPTGDLLSGFGHPAVITVAAVLVISRALRNSGIIDVITKRIEPLTKTPVLHITVLSVVVAFASAFMNNVGALAILLPVALATARERNRPPAMLLMPLAFGSILGGLMTMIGTPSNIIIAIYRADVMGEPFGMFDFSPVGVPVALIGVLFTALIGWRLLPKERQGQGAPDELFEIEHYLIEVRVTEDSPVIGKPLHSVERTLDDVIVTAVARKDGTIGRAAPWHVVQEGDVLVLKGDPTDLKPVIEKYLFEVVSDGMASREKLEPGSIKLMEAIVTPESPLVGRTPSFVQWRSGYQLRLMALGRAGMRVTSRLQNKRLDVGDILLLQGDENTPGEILSGMGLLPLPERGLKLGSPSRPLMTAGIFGSAIIAAAFGVLPIAVAFLAAIVAYIIVGTLTVRELYTHIDWPVIVLLGAMIPVGNALEVTGATVLAAEGLMAVAQGMPVWVLLMLVMVVTMFLSDVINNAATAVIMAPISVAIAIALNVNADAFLMSVAIGASCAFLTPIGHQSNTLVMGPGGYRFSDYWRMGLPLEVIIVAVSVPMILWVWPL